MFVLTRREAIRLLGGTAAAATCPRIAGSSDRARRISVLMAYSSTDQSADDYIAAFRDSLHAVGWNEGKDFRIDERRTTPEMDPIRRLAKEIVANTPDLIVASGARATLALSRETVEIPIVFCEVVDPVACGFIYSLERPGTNLTGVRTLEPTAAGEWLKLLKQLAPGITNVLMPFTPEAIPYAASFRRVVELDHESGITMREALIRDIAELDSLLRQYAGNGTQGLIPIPDGFMEAYRREIVALATRYRLPAVYFERGFVQAGGLVSYGTSNTDHWQQAAFQVHRILDGESPSALPVQRPGRLELVINAKAARLLGLVVPDSLRVRASQVLL